MLEKHRRSEMVSALVKHVVEQQIVRPTMMDCTFITEKCQFITEKCQYVRTAGSPRCILVRRRTYCNARRPAYQW